MKPQTTSLSHNITLVDADYIQPGVAATYIVRQDDAVAIIETGTSHTVPLLLEVLTTMGLSRDNVRYVIPTHVHLDHACGAGELIAQCPNAELVIHPRGAAHMIDPSKLIAGTTAVYGEEKFQQLYGTVTPVPENRVIEAPDNFELDMNGRTLRFLDTPGHARHHFCIHDVMSNGIFSGDTFGLCYPSLKTPNGVYVMATTTPVQFEPDAYVNSIDRMMSLDPDYFYLTHYGRIDADPNVAEQLKSCVLDFADMGLQAQQLPNRTKAIKAQMMEYLIANLQALGCECSDAEYTEWLTNDVELNVQGIDVWLKRQEKA